MQKPYIYILITAGIIGLLASFLLTIDTMKLAVNPDLDLPCNLNPFISCKSVIDSDQGKIFGFPNPLLGIAGFAAILTTGLLMFFGGTPSKRFWDIFKIGLGLATLLIHWFIYQSVFVIGSLCLYCMITWAVTWPVFVYTFINKNRPVAVGVWYLAVIFLILFHFRDFFFS